MEQPIRLNMVATGNIAAPGNLNLYPL
eukprot:SAG31_NODE_14011_length_832_cov_0.849932_2_plen_26_part_01